MRVLNTQQMREADRQTIDESACRPIVLMENAGRQAVAAMEAAFEDLASSRSACCAGAATTAATVSSSRARWRSAASRRRVPARQRRRRPRRRAHNLEILGRVG
jgi:hypothetical protein